MMITYCGPRIKTRSILFLLLLCLPIAVSAQTDPRTEVEKIANSVTAFNTGTPAEKLYIQTDKNTYNPGDTIWFKAYVFNAPYLRSTDKSGLFYLEIADANNLVVKRIMVPLYLGLGCGNIALSEEEYRPGYYTLRAYTNWMRNFDEHYIFKKQLLIQTNNDQNWLINSQYHITSQGDKQNATVRLWFNKVNGLPLVAQQLQLRMMNGTRTLFKDKATTSVDGHLNVNFELPEKAKGNQLVLAVKDPSKDDQANDVVVPILFNRKEYIDLQFMPEGGDLVAGIKTRVAFKSIAEDGNSTSISGTIVDGQQHEIARFSSRHLGMGSFDLLPLTGEHYTAVVKLPDGRSISYPLPVVKASGMSLNIVNPTQSDSLTLSISASMDMQNGGSYYLLGQARGVTCYAATFKPVAQTKTIRVSKSRFPTGIARFTLLNEGKQPVNERIVFIDRHDYLQTSISTHKKIYTPKDSVAMAIKASDKNGDPVSASFSISVTDDSRAKTNTFKNGNILSNLLLTTDLKGNVEDPDYYFDGATEEKTAQLDELLLTQGWIGNSWDEVLKEKRPTTYDAEKTFTVKGKVTNAFNKPVENAGVILLSKNPLLLKDTVTNKNGEFKFDRLYPEDTTVYTVQARNRNGKSFNVGVDVDEFKPPVFKDQSKKRMIPWNVNIDSAALTTVNTGTGYKLEQYKLSGVNELKEVKIIDKKVVKGSKNLNGDGEADFTLNEQDMQKAGKTTLYDLLFQKVKGFKPGGRWVGNPPKKIFIPYYQINTQFVMLIMDGINVTLSKPWNIPWNEYFREVTQGIYAEDIKGIEVMETTRFVAKYFSFFVNNPFADPADFAFIEVTTYSGKGPFAQRTPDVYVYRPLGFSIPKQFYSPKYTVKTNHTLPDTRSTIYWNPNVVTDKNGKASVSFYTADKPGTYTVIMEGSDMDGHLSSTQWQLVVK